MISNIVLNPSIDKTCMVEDLEIGQSNTVIDQRMDIGGEGILVCRIIKMLQSEPMVLSFLGGLNGRYIKSSLDKCKIKSNFTWVNGDTKLNTLFIDSVQGFETLVKDEGVTITEKDYLRFKQEMKNYIKDSAVVVLHGTLTSGLSYKLYEDVIEHAKRYNTKVIISTEGEELRKAFTYKPYGLCIKEKQLGELDIHSLSYKETLEELYKLMVEHSIHYITIDHGLKGATVLSKSKVCQGIPDAGIVPYNEKAGFSGVLGAFAVSVERKYELEKMVKLMVASGYGMMADNHKEMLCKKSDIDSYVKKIKVNEYMNNRSGWTI